jgi:RHS repeat-associated protein
MAAYEYDPFGRTIRMTGSLAQSNPFRFSTKRANDTSDLVLYEYRIYDPSTGRWLSRDPIVEHGGLNLFEFVENAPITRVDSTGLTILRFDYGTFIPAVYVIDPLGRRFAGDKRSVFTERGSHRTRQFVNVDTDTGRVSQFVDIGQTKELDKDGNVIKTGFSPKSSFHARLVAWRPNEQVVKMEGNGIDPLAFVDVDVPQGPGPGSTTMHIPPPGITYSETIKIDLCLHKISWKGEHDAFPAHEFFVEHDLEHGFRPKDVGQTYLLKLFPIFPNVKFEGSRDYQ